MKQAKVSDKHVRARRADNRDAEVGRRVRSRRLECRLSQTELADRIGVTFQQVQKYEKGVNRTGAMNVNDVAPADEVLRSGANAEFAHHAERLDHVGSLQRRQGSAGANTIERSFRTMIPGSVRL